MSMDENTNDSTNDSESMDESNQRDETTKNRETNVNDETFQKSDKSDDDSKNKFENFSEYSIIGFVFLIVGLSMVLTMKNVAFSAFIILGTTFIAIGYDEQKSKAKEKDKKQN